MANFRLPRPISCFSERPLGRKMAMATKFAARLVISMLIGVVSLPLATAQDGGCQNWPLAFQPGTDGRPRVEGDYLVIVYNARSLQTYWYDYNHPSLAPVIRNGSFLPVVYAKEKIAVRVCDLQFGDVLTVTTSPFGLPEGGADIRGATTPATTIPALTPTLDALQSSSATGGPLQIGGLGFSAPSALSISAINGLTPGNFSVDKSGTPTYTSATVTLSPVQLAMLMFSIQESARGLYDSISEVWRGTHGRAELPGSVEYLKDQASQLLTRVNTDAREKSNSALFDRDLTDAQSLVAELSTLSTALSSQSFGARAAALQTNFATIRGIVDLAHTGSLPNNCGIPPPAVGTKITIDRTVKTYEAGGETKTVQSTVITTTKDPTSKDEKPKVTECPDIGGIAPQPSGQDAFANFYSAYQSELYRLCSNKRNDEIEHGARNPFSCTNPDVSDLGYLFDRLHLLGQDLQDLDQKTGELFNAINDWNRDSHVEQTDLLTPISGNALERISIVVQHGYTPFVVSGPPASIASTAAPAPAPAPTPGAPPSATTSTPAHSVKTILVEVHRRANFNLAGGPLLIHVPTSMFAPQLSPSPPVAVANPPAGATQLQQGTCNGQTSPIPGSVTGTTFTNYYCVTAIQTTEWQVEAMAAMVWYPWGRDYFPRKSGLSIHTHDMLPSLLMGTSVTSLGNAVGAVNFEPISGIDFFAGIGSAHSLRLADGLAPNSPIGVTSTTTAPTLQTVTTVHAGFSVGIALDIGVFTQLFTKTPGTSSATLP